MAEELLSRRAAKPSKKSKIADATTSQNASLKSPFDKIAMAALVPHTKLPSVRKFGIVNSLIFIILQKIALIIGKDTNKFLSLYNS
jgi:hypothetical protein